jgi:hypothetical protein
MSEHDEAGPATEPFGLLQLPPVYPPTAVGLATAPRPPRPGRYPARLTRVRRIALALFALLLWAGAGALLSPFTAHAAGATALAVTGAHVALRALAASDAPLRLLASSDARRTPRVRRSRKHAA